jgi:hypothetical protein
MEKRKAIRKKKRIMVKLDQASAILVDISRNGIRVSSGIAPSRRKVEIELNNERQNLKLQGDIRWIKRKVALQKLYDIGISIIKAPDDYYQFIDTLQI